MLQKFNVVQVPVFYCLFMEGLKFDPVNNKSVTKIGTNVQSRSVRKVKF